VRGLFVVWTIAYFWVDDGIDMGIPEVDALWEALVHTLIGILAAFISLHMMNGTAVPSGRLARVMPGAPR